MAESHRREFGQPRPLRLFHRDRTGLLVGVDGKRVRRGACPAVYGAAGTKLWARSRNNAASGQEAAKATRTREAVSITRAATFISRSRMVVNSAVVSACALGMPSRTLSNSQ